MWVSDTDVISSIFAQYVDDSTTSSLPAIITFAIPPGRYWAVTTTRLSLSTGYAQRL